MNDNDYKDLAFQDWIQLHEWNNPDWITLSLFTFEKDLFWTHSVLLHLDRIEDMEESVPIELREAVKKYIFDLLFSDYYLDNNLHGDFGIPNVLGDDDGTLFNDKFVDDRGLIFRPIIYTTEYSEGSRKTDHPIDITPCSKLTSLYRLRRNPSNYTRVERMGNEIEVIKIEKEKGKISLKISTKYIRDFLTLSNMALVRIHSHQRIRYKDFSEEELTYRDNQHFYKIMIANSVFRESHEVGKTRSLLRGIDVVLPYDNPINENRVLGPKPNHNIEFIVGRNKDGSNKTLNPIDAAYSSRTFLLNVCFRQEVLQKFYQKYELYTVSEGIGIKGPGYNLSYNNAPEDTIMVYLGDLNGLPVEELHHFRGYNIPCPKNSITEDRFRRDFLVEFTEPTELEYKLKKLLTELNNTFQEVFDFPLFDLENPKVSDFLKLIHIPLTKEKKEFEDIILAANKVFVESILSKKIKKLLKNNEVHNLKSLKILEKFLEQRFPEIVPNLSYLFYLNDLRSLSAAHLSGKDYLKFIEKHGFNKNETIEIINWVIIGIIIFLEKFIQLLQN